MFASRFEHIAHGSVLGPWGPCRCGSSSLPACSPLVTCSNMSVPLEYGNNSSARITVHVTRVSASNGSKVPQEPSHGTLFWVNGGPAFSPFGAALSNPNFEVLTMQPRGLQWSSPLECVPGDNGQTAPTLTNMKACAANLAQAWPSDGIKHFTATNHAKDLHELMSAYDDELKAPRNKFMYGVSYGTYVVQRFMSIKPTHPVKAVVLD